MLLLGLSSLVFVRFYFARGELTFVADTSVHTSYAWIASRSFSHREIPLLTNYFSTGSPYLQFYGFPLFYLVGLADQVFRDLFFSIKS